MSVTPKKTPFFSPNFTFLSTLKRELKRANCPKQFYERKREKERERERERERSLSFFLRAREANYGGGGWSNSPSLDLISPSRELYRSRRREVSGVTRRRKMPILRRRRRCSPPPPLATAAVYGGKMMEREKNGEMSGI